jgi:hypothetical protein
VNIVRWQNNILWMWSALTQPPVCAELSLCALAFGSAWGAVACSQTVDAGFSKPHGLLPVDERNPLVIMNDGAVDNWQGEYAMLLANGGGPPLAGIIVNTSPPWTDLDENVAKWRAMVTAARNSGLRGIPDPIASVGGPLVKPASGQIEDTVPNRSEGARFILDAAERLSLPYRPLVIATGGRVTDLADAYLVDPSVADKIVVVASLGSLTTAGATTSVPNGSLDPWATVIVSQRLRYVQISAFYDQLSDVPASRVEELPDNEFGAWMAAKQPSLLEIEIACDQIGVLAAGLPTFAVAVARVSPGEEPASGGGPDLTLDPAGRDLLVTESAGPLAAARLWELLLEPKTFGN